MHRRRTAELPEQARLAYTRLADQAHYLSVAPLRVRGGAAQHLDFLLASDKLRKIACRQRVKAHPRIDAVQLSDLYGRVEPRIVTGSKAPARMKPLARAKVSRVSSVVPGTANALESRRHVRSAPDCPIVDGHVFAMRLHHDDHGPRIDADAYLHLHAELPLHVGRQ